MPRQAMGRWGNRLLKCAMCIAASPRARKPVGGEIARCAIESSAASFGLRLSSRREAASDSPYWVSPPHRTQNGFAVTKGHEKFKPFNNEHKGSVAELPTNHRHETWASGKFQGVFESRNSSVGELIQLQNFFVSLRDGSKSRFVSAAGDETRQGETEMAAPLKAKP